MEGSNQEKKNRKKVFEDETFPVPFMSVKKGDNNPTIYKAKPNQISKSQVIIKAFEFHSQGNILEAEKNYKYLINNGFHDPRVLSNYGIICRKKGKKNLAKKLYLRSISLYPHYADAYSNLSFLLKEDNDPEEALIYAQKAIELNPRLADAHLNLGWILDDLGKSKEAELSTRKAIELNPDYPEAYCNLGIIQKGLGKIKESELSLLKAIMLNPNYAEAHYNLGNILIDLGKLEEAELSLIKAIEKNSELTAVYYVLSLLKNTKNKIWKQKLFSKNILRNKSHKDLVNIYFAKTNIFHKRKNYQDSAKYLLLANNLKLIKNPSKTEILINKSHDLLNELDKKKINQKEQKSYPESIFIVGMPRSGSTLLESILSLNSSVDDLGEINILEESFIEWKKDFPRFTLSDIYWEKISNQKAGLNITTNKFLYNYQYAGIIAHNIKNSKIIHCYRNPLDNILSIYRAHFAHGNEYSSSLIDCTNVYLNQEKIMREYKRRFRSKIYDLDYDSLVKNPDLEIKSLISWLNWKWDDTYLSPHLNQRSVSTASSVDVRSPINSKSSGGWKNYKEMLKPAIEILKKTDKYKEITL